MRKTEPHLTPAQQSRLRAKKLQKACSAQRALSGTFCPPWHDGWLTYYSVLLAGSSPLLGAHLSLECAVAGGMLWAALRVREGRA